MSYDIQSSLDLTNFLSLTNSGLMTELLLNKMPYGKYQITNAKSQFNELKI